MPNRPIILPVLKKNVEPTAPVKKTTLDLTKKTILQKFIQKRRKRKRDRRQEVRDGVIVSLSFENDRRKNRDRRRV
ncbi:MAG: hypothetical protein RBR67_06705 [Desulfobacterium sp.]|nr:hypothetical protein [Desulfobacterium sp.]